ncbi:MAG: hypothetical protein IJ491_05235 [Clostridia bacterium]|nr:hypothetical protein [Clostridia bacterium]
MKKILSVILAVMMLFGALSVGASAASIYPDQWHQSGLVADNQAVLVFNLNGGTLKSTAIVYNSTTGQFEEVSGFNEATYYMLPAQGNPTAHTVGTVIVLPDVIPPTGYSFAGWQYRDADGLLQQPGALANFYIQDWIFTGNNYGKVEFTAVFTPAEAEEDTLAKVMSILVKVFGAIIGIVLYGGDTEQGVALMNKVLGGVMG